MPTAREPRPSETTFLNVMGMVRSMDKLLWYGKKYHLEDLKEYAEQIKKDIDKSLEEFKNEIK